MPRRKRRLGEVVCRCGAYKFPHRLLGGRCDGGHIVYETFQNGLWSTCKDCHFLDEHEGVMLCQVLEGQDKVIYCPELQEVIRYNEVRLYGVNADEKIENPKRRRRRR